MNTKERTRASKFLSLVLRHEPQKIGLSLDAAGWVCVDQLLEACGRHRHPLDRRQLEEIVETNEKRRFAFSSVGLRIRASQGHSIEVSLGYAAQTPPETLYHGTATRFLQSIMAEGLRRAERHHVHLTASRDLAVEVGRRHGKPVVLAVAASAMSSAGHAFWLSENQVWLSEHVPVQFLTVAEDSI